MVDLLLDTRSLMVLREVEAHGSIAQAALALGISPAAASQRLSRLALRLGVDLTVGDGRGIRLTPVGRRLAFRAVRICRQLEIAERELDEEMGLPRLPAVSVATFATAAAGLLPDIVDRLGTGAGVRISIAELPVDAAIPSVISGIHDLAVIPTYEPSTLAQPATTVAKVIATEPLDLVARPSVAGQAVTLSALSREPWISGPAGSTFARAIESTCRAIGGFTPDVAHRVSDAAAIIALAERGLGVGLLPRLATRTAPRHLIHRAPGTVARSIIVVCLPESLEHAPVKQVWDALEHTTIAGS